MSKPIDFYFDFSSPYGYLASTCIEELAAKYGRTVKWHPVLLGAIFKITGAAPLSVVPLKGEYSLRDFERSARFYGIRYRNPSEFPLSTQAAARAMLWIRKQHGEEKAVAFCKAVYHAYFVDDLRIDRPEVLAQIAFDLDLDAARLIEGSNDPALKEQFKADVDAAIKRGVFGSPFMIVDDEPFWGFDRFAQLEAFLKDGKI
jgi:2-hydroxychromene-2-carboxylate isomerase